MVTDLAGRMANDASVPEAWIVTVFHEVGVERGKARGELIWPVPEGRQMLPKLPCVWT